MTGNVFDAWTSIFVAAITFAALAVGVPIAVIKTLALVETAGSWTLDRVHRLMRKRSAAADLGGRHRLNPAPTRSIEEP